MNRINEFFKKIFGFINRKPAVTEEQILTALIEGEKSGAVESKERTMVEGVFYLGDRPVGAFMTHRSEIKSFDISDDSEEVCREALENRDQRCYPVTDGKPDEIIGAAYLEDIIIDKMTEQNKGLRALMKNAYFVPQTMPAIKAFESFRKAQADYIFVIDEYGGFAGMLSLRDLTEEIVGELPENEEETDTIIRNEDGTWLADGGVNIDDIAEELLLPDLAEEHPEYHTLAGFILELTGELPKAGDSFSYKNYNFTIRAMDVNRIDKVLIESRELSGKLETTWAAPGA